MLSLAQVCILNVFFIFVGELLTSTSAPIFHPVYQTQITNAQKKTVCAKETCANLQKTVGSYTAKNKYRLI